MTSRPATGGSGMSAGEASGWEVFASTQPGYRLKRQPEASSRSTEGPRFAGQGRETKMSSTRGGCLCGAVRFVATGQPMGTAWCHCQSCRKHSGAPVSVFVAFKRNAYTVTKGEITKFNSSPGRLRGFCARCGSTLTCEGESSSEMHIHIGAFDEAARFEPTRHIFPEERLPWLRLSGRD